MVPTSRRSKATLRQLLLGQRLTPGDHVFDATADGEFIEILEFLGLNVDDPFENSGPQQPGRSRLVLARPEDRSPQELSRTIAEWLGRLSPGGTLVLVDAGQPDVLSAYPGVTRAWSSDGVTFSSLTISSLVRAPAEWHEFVPAGVPTPARPAA